MNNKSFIDRIEIKFEELQNKLWIFLSGLEIKSINHNFELMGYSMVSVGRPDYQWHKLTIEQEKQHIEICKLYKSFILYLDMLVEHTPENIHQRYKKIKKEFEIWVYIKKNFAINNISENNNKSFLKSATQIKNIIELFKDDKKKVIVVPDTNALLIQPDPGKYKDVINKNVFTFILLPTVISELDQLKVKKEGKDVGEKAKKLITRIKGWRKQGGITTGITVNKTITLKAEVEDPKLNIILPWLNHLNNDDKIIIHLLDIQRRFPSANVILVTNDINMQNKAEYAMIECIDIDCI